MRNQTSFRLTTTLQPSDTTAKTTQVINKVDSDGNKFYPTFTEETVVLTNDDRTVMETTRASCSNWVLTFVKRGLSDDASATEVDNRKLTWNPWTIAFITAWAADWIDIDDDLTWTGKQTYTGDMEAQWKATYKWLLITEKGVQYPSFADTTALEAYADPFGWMFATVESTGELYRYNAKTEQWDLVSTVELGTYTIQVDDEKPAPWTADTIITFSPELHEIYAGTDWVINNRCIDLLVVWWWGGWGRWCSYQWWWGWWGGWVAFYNAYNTSESSFCVKIWAWGCGGVSDNWGNWCPSSFGNIIAWWWGGWGKGCCAEWNSWANWWWWGSAPSRDRCWGAWYSNSNIVWHWWWPSCHFSMWQAAWLWQGGQWGSPLANWISSTVVNEWLWVSIWWCNIIVSVGGGGGRWTCSCCTPTHWSMCQCYWSWWWWGVGGSADCCCWNDGKWWVVIVAYPADWSYWYSCATGGTVTCGTLGDKTYCIHTFTEDWTFCIVS